MIKIVIPLPNYGFDPTETSIPWKLFTENNIQVYFATPNGKKAACDVIMLTGKRLGVWKSLLKARKDAQEAYQEMKETSLFVNPLTYDEIREKDFDGIFLPGGHDKGVIEYLESPVLQKIIPDFFNSDKKIAAICHGVILLAKSKNSSAGKSVLYNFKTTALLKSQELLAYNLTRFWLKDYYLTYPKLTVEDEVKSVLEKKTNFIYGPKPLFRDRKDNLRAGFSLRDRNYISARWPGDIYNISYKFIEMLKES
ncbi:MAG: type 1 glutamine amidotransferase domain-containing protein [Flavobacteriaceae bacterium]|nr:type 1 glutamine amidotransferase domain-containing protein [Flavobacteriaceae bacterium]